GLCRSRVGAIPEFLEIEYVIAVEVAVPVLVQAAEEEQFELIKEKIAVTVDGARHRHTVEAEADHFECGVSAAEVGQVGKGKDVYLTGSGQLEILQQTEWAAVGP